jgi:hypothetical protein
MVAANLESEGAMQLPKTVVGRRWYLTIQAAAIVLVVSTGVTTTVLGQVPERRALPPARDPGALPPAGAPGTRDPMVEPVELQPGAAAPAVVRPGTIQQGEAGAVPSRELIFLEPGEKPANVSVTATGARSVTLQWSPTTGAFVYWVHRSQGGGPFYRGNLSTTETSFTVHGLLPGTAYSFKVSATYPQEMRRREGMSEPVSATTATAPAVTGLVATVTGKNQVTVTWDKLPEADWFRLHRIGALVTDLKPVKVTHNAPPTPWTRYVDSVGPGTHQYQIQAIYVSGSGQIVSPVAPTPPVVVILQPSTRVRYCRVLNAPPACGQPAAKPAAVAAVTSLPELRRETP